MKNKPDLTTPGGRVRAARTARKETLETVAAAIGVARAYLTDIELNNERGGLETWEALATYFGVSLQYLRTGARLDLLENPDIRETAVAMDRLGADDRLKVRHLVGSFLSVADSMKEASKPEDARAGTVAKMEKPGNSGKVVKSFRRSR